MSRVLVLPGAGRRSGLDAVSPLARLLAGRPTSNHQVFSHLQPALRTAQSTARKKGVSRRSLLLFSRLCRSICSMASSA